MKRNLLMLVAVAFMVISISSCGTKSSSRLIDLLNGYSDKIIESSSMSEIADIVSELTKELEPYYNDDTELSESEKNEIIEAYTKVGVYELFKLSGNDISPEGLQDLVEYSAESYKKECKDCKTIKELLKTLDSINTQHKD